MSKVFVLDANKRPLVPTHPGRARQLLDKGKASVYRRYPFIIILKREIENIDSPPLRLKIDPGSKTTGLAISNDNTGEVVWAAELQHRGQQIKISLDSRRAIRRSRRNRKTRYREPRFNNRTRPKGWLPPSLMSRVYNIETWVARLRRYCPITAISMELAKFDIQQMENPEISGAEYQQGELFGYEIREYLLEKFDRKCAYCNAENVPLQVEHIIPKARGGSDRVSNLTIACVKCNQRKGNQTAEEFGYPEVQTKAQKPLRDAAVLNATRWEIYRRLQKEGLPIEIGSGGRTKFNRAQRSLPKSHWLDAVCVGESTPKIIKVEGVQPLSITAMGYGNRQMCGTNKYGFPIRHRTRQKQSFGFQTGDLGRAVVPKGKYVGTHTGRVTIRSRPSFRLNDFDVHPKYIAIIQKIDGYSYALIPLHG